MHIQRNIFVLVFVCVLGTIGAQCQLRVGAVKVDVTGKFGSSQTGKYDHERVYVRAIVLDNGSARAVLISFEGDTGGQAAVEAVAKELDCPVQNVIISSTHTHSARLEPTTPPIAGGSRSAVPSRQRDETTIPSMLEAVRQAKAKLEPARAGYSTGASYLNVNRDGIDPETRKWIQYSNLDAASDKTVAVLTFEKPSGEPIAVYVNYAMHLINGYVLDIVSGDFAGAMSRYVEKAFGDKIVVAFTQGASGDQNPLYLRPSNNAMASRLGNTIPGFEINREKNEGPLRSVQYGVAEGEMPKATEPDPKVIDELFRFIESEGQVLGEEVIRVMTWTDRWSGDVRIQGLEKDVSCPGRKRTNGNPFSATSREGVEGTYVDGPPRVYQIGVLGVGTTAIAWINGEIFTLIGEKTKRAAPMNNTMFSTISNAVTGGYTPDDASYGKQTFQVLDSVVKPGCAETSIVKTVGDLEAQYLNLTGK
jgi:hypothetical protein